MAPKENMQGNLSQLMHAWSLNLCNLIWEIHFMVNWKLSNQGIPLPVSHDRIAGSSVAFTQFTCFLKVYRWLSCEIFFGSLAQVFSQIIRTSQKFEAPLLGLAKSIHYILDLKIVLATAGECSMICTRLTLRGTYLGEWASANFHPWSPYEQISIHVTKEAVVFFLITRDGGLFIFFKKSVFWYQIWKDIIFR